MTRSLQGSSSSRRLSQPADHSPDPTRPRRIEKGTIFETENGGDSYDRYVVGVRRRRRLKAVTGETDGVSARTSTSESELAPAEVPSCRFCGLPLDDQSRKAGYHESCVTGDSDDTETDPLEKTRKLYGQPPRPLTWG